MFELLLSDHGTDLERLGQLEKLLSRLFFSFSFRIVKISRVRIYDCAPEKRDHNIINI